MYKKIIALIMALCMVAPLFAMPSYAQNNSENTVMYSQKLSFDIFSFLQWDMRMIGMNDVPKTGLTGKGVRVGIVDSGVSTNTKELDGRLLAGKNMSDASKDTQDKNGHGTAIAGIIGAAKGNGVGISGVAPGVTIVPLKTNDYGSSLSSVNANSVIAAVDEFDCDVINLSFGSKRSDERLHDAIKYAVSKGVIVVCSTGNDGTEEFYYPGAYEETIGVGGVDRSKKASDFSHKNESIFVTAPGNYVISLSRIPYFISISSGTSVSAPFVSGIAALLKERYPEMNTDDFEEILKMSCEDLGETGYDTTYGWGLVNAPRAIAAADLYFAQ